MDPPPLILNDNDIFCNSDGCIRRALVRKTYGLHYIDGTNVLAQVKPLKLRQLEEISDLYVTWRDDIEKMPVLLTYTKNNFMDFSNIPVDPDKWINGFIEKTGKIAVRHTPNSPIVYYESEDHELRFIESIKRGNSRYIELLQQKFKPLFQSKEHKQFFSTYVNKKRKIVQRTRLLYVTGTTDPKYYNYSISNAWLGFGKTWNTFITSIRQQFGKVLYLRVWQTHENGYPHFHALLYFPDYEFTTIKNREFNPRKNKYEYIWRVHNRQKLNNRYVRDRIKETWKAGYLDIKCCSDTKKAIKDIVKYVTRELQGGKENITNAAVWYFGKQVFAISKGFLELFKVKSIVEPNDADLINAIGVTQRDSSNKKLIRIEVFPYIRDKILKKTYENTLYNWSDLDADPPPVVNFVNNFINSCAVSSVKVRDDGVFVMVYKKNSELYGNSFSVTASKFKVPCATCGSVENTKNVLGVWVCKDCLNDVV